MRTVTVHLTALVAALAACTCSAGPNAPRAPRLSPVASPPGDRRIVRSADLVLERDEPDAGPARVAEVTERLGGYVARSGTTSIDVMIPAPRFDEALRDVVRLGEVARKDVYGEDVTEEHQDLSIRLDNFEKSRMRFVELLAMAQNVEQAVLVEKEIERVTVEIERLKGRLKSLDERVAYARLAVHFERPVTPGPLGWVFYGLYKGVKWLFVWD
jgi:hypothetical protein